MSTGADDYYRLIKLDGVIVHRVGRVDDKDGWIELGYEEGAIEFTIVQMTLYDDHRITQEQLSEMYAAMKTILNIRSST